jgi:hypothetical protein
VCLAIHPVLSSLLYARLGMVIEAFPLAPRHGVWWSHCASCGGTMGMAVIHQLLYMA